MEPGLEGNRPGRLNSPTILGHTPKSQDNCERLSCKTARPDKIGTHPGWGSGPLFSAPPKRTVDAVSERVWSEGRAVDELPRPFR